VLGGDPFFRVALNARSSTPKWDRRFSLLGLGFLVTLDADAVMMLVSRYGWYGHMLWVNSGSRNLRLWRENLLYLHADLDLTVLFA